MSVKQLLYINIFIYICFLRVLVCKKKSAVKGGLRKNLNPKLYFIDRVEKTLTFLWPSLNLDKTTDINHTLYNSNMLELK